MNRKIKLIWDFRGEEARHTAEHHAVHLREFAARESLSPGISGVEEHSAMHWSAYLVVEEKEMISVRNALRPVRGEVWEE